MNVNKTAIQRYIEVKPEVRKDIIQELGITCGGLSYALRYKRDGEISRRARELAIAQGGIVIYAPALRKSNGDRTLRPH